MPRRIYRNEILKYLHENHEYDNHAGIIADELDLSEYQVVSSIENMIKTGYANIKMVSPKVYRLDTLDTRELTPVTQMTPAFKEGYKDYVHGFELKEDRSFDYRDGWLTARRHFFSEIPYDEEILEGTYW